MKKTTVGRESIPENVWTQIVNTFLPGTDTAEAVKAGKSRSATLRRLCRLDTDTRKRVRALAVKLLRDEAGLTEEALTPAPINDQIAYWRQFYESVEKDEVAKYGRSTLTAALHDPNNKSLLADQLAGRLPFPFATAEELVADLKEATHG